MVDWPSDRGRWHRRSGHGARSAARAHRARHRDIERAGSRLRGVARFGPTASSAQRHRADSLPRLRRHRRGAHRPRCLKTGAMDRSWEPAPTRCGIDSIEIARIERMLAELPPADLTKIFSAQELADSGDGAGRAASLAARYAAKEACAKLFPRELALGQIEPADFSVRRDTYGAPEVVCGAKAQAMLGRHRLAGIAVSLTHDRASASAVALALPAHTVAPLAGRVLFRLLPFRRGIVLDNLRRVFGPAVPPAEIDRLAQAHYAHLWRLGVEFLKFRWLSAARKRSLVRVENLEAFVRAFEANKGVLILTGHFGNWEVATVAGIQSYPQVHGRFHFVRRPIKPRWLDDLVTRRFARAGFGVVGKRGSLDRIVALLEAGDVIVFPFDQHAPRPDGTGVDFFGHPP